MSYFSDGDALRLLPIKSMAVITFIPEVVIISLFINICYGVNKLKISYGVNTISETHIVMSRALMSMNKNVIPCRSFKVLCLRYKINVMHLPVF